jgi:glutathione synthase/RimK-type ligase-like ATP-grasp enzyme
MTRAIVLVPDPNYPEAWDWAYDIEAAALERGGIKVEARPWTDDALFDADIVLPLVAWGYHAAPVRWHGLLDRLESEGKAVANAVSVLRWNSDKRYLLQLESNGIPTIPTRFVPALDEAAIEDARRAFGSELIVKPPVSAAADGTYRIGRDDTIPDDVRNKAAMIQPFLSGVMEEGEYSILMFEGAFSHSVVKRPNRGDFRVQPHLGGREEPCAPPDDAIAVARAALAMSPEPPAYARVDLVRGPEGQLKVIELELIEPSLWLEHAPDGGASFAAAILRRARP